MAFGLNSGDVANIGSGLSAVGDLLGGFGAASSDRANASALRTNAGIYGQNVSLTNQKTALQLLQQKRQAFQVLGGQKNDYAAAGLKVSGSALDVIRSSASAASLDAQLIQQAGAIEATGWAAKQQEATAAAAGAQTKAKTDVFGGILKAGLSLLPLLAL